MLGFNCLSTLTQMTQIKKHTPLKIHLSRANKISNFLDFVRYFQQTSMAHRWYQHYLNLPHYLGVILKSKPSLGAFVHAYAWNYLAVELVSKVNFSQKKNSHFKKEARCKTFQMKVTFICRSRVSVERGLTLFTHAQIVSLRR